MSQSIKVPHQLCDELSDLKNGKGKGCLIMMMKRGIYMFICSYVHRFVLELIY